MTNKAQNVDALLRFLPLFDQDGYAGGTWSATQGDNAIPFFELDDDAAAFVQACYRHGWVLTDLDWGQYAQTPEARALRDNPAALAEATQQQLAQLLTILIRQDHLADGAFAEAIASGLVRGILRRLDQIADKLGHTRYRAQVREVTNRNTFVSLALAQGFNAYLPVYDGGVDFILYREKDNLIRKVQLKGRWTIDRKYLGRDIWVALPITFPTGVEWYLVPHQEMVEFAKADGKTKTDSWVKDGLYSTGKPSKAIVAACAPHRFGSIATVANEAAEGSAFRDQDLAQL